MSVKESELSQRVFWAVMLGKRVNADGGEKEDLVKDGRGLVLYTDEGRVFFSFILRC